MSRKINLSIGTVWRGRYVFEVVIDGSTVHCKAAKIYYSKEEWQVFNEAEGMLVEVSEEWLKELDALEIFSWEKEYDDVSKGTDGIWWILTFEDGEKIYRGHGIDTAHKNWSRFMDWLGAIFKEKDRWVDI